MAQLASSTTQKRRKMAQKMEGVDFGSGGRARFRFRRKVGTHRSDPYLFWESVFFGVFQSYLSRVTMALPPEKNGAGHKNGSTSGGRKGSQTSRAPLQNTWKSVPNKVAAVGFLRSNVPNCRYVSPTNLKDKGIFVKPNPPLVRGIPRMSPAAPKVTKVSNVTVARTAVEIRGAAASRLFPSFTPPAPCGTASEAIRDGYEYFKLICSYDPSVMESLNTSGILKILQYLKMAYNAEDFNRRIVLEKLVKAMRGDDPTVADALEMFRRRMSSSISHALPAGSMLLMVAHLCKFVENDYSISQVLNLKKTQVLQLILGTAAV